MAKNKQAFDYRQSAGIFIGSDINAKGNIDTSDDIVIDGQFEGSIITTGFCEISENGRVKGDIKSHSLTIFGEFNGDCRVDEGIVVKNTSKVIGYLISSTICVDPGALLKVRIKQSTHSNSGHSI